MSLFYKNQIVRTAFICCLLIGLSQSALFSQSAMAQGLLWKLPAEENVSVLYYGKFSQQDISKGNTGEVGKTITWDREIIVKSLKKANGYYNGKQVACRWIEISVRTGQLDDGDINTGPAGQRIYKVLVPESKIISSTTDDNKILVSMIPVALDKDGKVMGVKKIGETNPKRMTVSVLKVHPMLSLLGHYRTLKQETGGEPLTLLKGQPPVSSDQYKKYTASQTTESPAHRSTNTATIYCTDRIPTGIAQWEIKERHEAKNSSQSRKEFAPTYEYRSKMTAREVVKGNVQSQLPDLSELN